MCRYGLCAVLLAAVLAASAQGQTKTSMPSEDEILELLSKADEKVSGFEEVLKNVRPDLDKAAPTLSTKYLNAASIAHVLIKAMQKTAPSGEGLVGLVATLDDLSLDAATAAVQLLNQIVTHPQERSTSNSSSQVMLLMTSKNACNDIAELLLHATLRYIHVEEDVIAKLSEQLSNKKR